jgi:hypothetical protein
MISSGDGAPAMISSIDSCSTSGSAGTAGVGGAGTAGGVAFGSSPSGMR